MKYSTILLGILLSGTALAAELPITGAYGDPLGCLRYEENGRAGVLESYPRDLPGWEDDSGEDYFDGWLVTSTEWLQHGTICVPLSSTLGKVNFSCKAVGGTYIFEENISLNNNILTFTSVEGPLDLHPCPIVTEPATM